MAAAFLSLESDAGGRDRAGREQHQDGERDLGAPLGHLREAAGGHAGGRGDHRDLGAPTPARTPRPLGRGVHLSPQADLLGAPLDAGVHPPGDLRLSDLTREGHYPSFLPFLGNLVFFIMHIFAALSRMQRGEMLHIFEYLSSILIRRGSSAVERSPEEAGVGCSTHPRGTYKQPPLGVVLI